MAYDPQTSALRPEQDVNQMSVTGLQPAQRALTSLQVQPQQTLERSATALPEMRPAQQPMPQEQPAIAPERAISDNRVFEDRARAEAMMKQRAEMAKPISWEHTLPVQQMRAESPETFAKYKNLMVENGVIDQNGLTNQGKMQEFLVKASVNPELYEQMTAPKIQMVDKKFDDVSKKYNSLKEKTHPDDIQGMAKLKELEKTNNELMRQRDEIWSGYYNGRKEVESASEKMQTKQAIGQFLVEHEPFIRNLPPMEQKFMQQLFMTGDIEGFSSFLGDHPDLTTAYNARGQR